MLVTLNDVLIPAQRNHYAVGLFNTIDTDMLEAVIAAAETLQSPVIIGTAEILLAYGSLSLIAPSLVAAAKRARVPVVLHYDHGLTFERCMEALQCGFSSVMLDASTHPYAENVRQTREMVKIAHALGATVEGEIGHVGDAERPEAASEERYTMVAEAQRYAAETGVDALAVAIGTAHGVYKAKPNLSFERLRALAQAVDVPLVLHGGSGLSDDDFRQSIQDGIAKVNIFTDLCLAGMSAMARSVGERQSYLEARNVKRDAIQAVVMQKMKLFGSVGRA